MADWREAEDYAYTEGLTLRQWAWEFIRRSSSYRILWRRHQSRAEPLSGGNDEDAGKAARVADQGLRVAIFGLHRGWVDPSLTATEVDEARLKWDSGLRVVSVFGASLERILIDLPPDQVRVDLAFDLRRPIDEQAKDATVLLETTQREAETRGFKVDRPRGVRFERDRLLLYVRLLDADDAGVSVGDMGRAFFKGKVDDSYDSASNALAQAHYMRDAGYADLLRAKPRGKRKLKGGGR